jgi:hypothetical protein
MNKLLKILLGGDLKSDGRANEVADKVLGSPDLFDKLAEGLNEPNDVIRARTAHALERISRTHPEMMLSQLQRLIELGIKDPVPMVKWHIAMIFGNLTVTDAQQDMIYETLLRMLKDKSVFVRSWSIVSLTILGRKDTEKRPEMIRKLNLLQKNKSKAIQNKVKKALSVKKMTQNRFRQAGSRQ